MKVDDDNFLSRTNSGEQSYIYFVVTFFVDRVSDL